MPTTEFIYLITVPLTEQVMCDLESNLKCARYLNSFYKVQNNLTLIYICGYMQDFAFNLNSIKNSFQDYSFIIILLQFALIALSYVSVYDSLKHMSCVNTKAEQEADLINEFEFTAAPLFIECAETLLEIEEKQRRRRFVRKRKCKSANAVLLRERRIKSIPIIKPQELCLEPRNRPLVLPTNRVKDEVIPLNYDILSIQYVITYEAVVGTKYFFTKAINC